MPQNCLKRTLYLVVWCGLLSAGQAHAQATQPREEAPPPRVKPVISSELKACMSRFDTHIYNWYRSGSTGEIKRTPSGEIDCSRKITILGTDKITTETIPCYGTECINDLLSVYNFDYIVPEGGAVEVCSVKLLFAKSACMKKIAEAHGEKNFDPQFGDAFACTVSEADCMDFFRFLACEYNAKDRIGELGLVGADGKIDPAKCEEVRNRLGY